VPNHQKGVFLRNKFHISQQIPAADCWLCEGLTSEIQQLSSLIANQLQEYEYSTFLIGSKIDEEIVQKEEQLWSLLAPTDTEPLKMEINREIGKILENKLGKLVNFEDPDIMVILDTSFHVLSLQIKSLYLYGRYKKFDRTIPQTKWPCRVCRGKGCKHCHDTGKLYETSVEEIIAGKALPLTKGTDESLHGSGREDIDARMLGNGRPFVLEIKNPKIRTIDLDTLEQTVNSSSRNIIEISSLRYSTKDEVARIKAAEFQKTYRILIEATQVFHKEKLKKACRTLRGTIIKQFTPTRVAHRRANKVRERKIYNCEVESIEGTIARLVIETDSGTYIKELVSGDNQKTTPSLSELLGIPCVVKELDVIEIKGE